METALRTLEGVPLKGLDLRLEKVAVAFQNFERTCRRGLSDGVISVGHDV